MKLPLLTLLVLPLAACTTHVVVEQPKPLDININFTGHLDLVIHDARQNLEQITGEKPANVVNLEDIGLPAKKPGATGGATNPLELRSLSESYDLASDDVELFPILFSQPRTVRRADPDHRLFAVAVQDDLTKSLAARNPQIRALWDSKAVGEAHTGLLAPKAALNADQQKLVDAENADRSALYAADAKTKSTPVDDVAISYYVARLGYAKPGNWYEKRNPAGQWEWKQWGQ